MRTIMQDLAQLVGKERAGWKELVKRLLTHSGFQVVVLYRMSSYLRRNRLKVFSFIIDRISYHLFHAEIKSSACIAPGFVINHTLGIVIGGKVVAGKNLNIRQNTTLGGNNNKLRQGNITQPIIGDDVTIGANCVLVGPITVGDRCYISSMSFVNKDVPTDEVWGGVPARKLK